jgi:hypothetical protein
MQGCLGCGVLSILMVVVLAVIGAMTGGSKDSAYSASPSNEVAQQSTTGGQDQSQTQEQPDTAPAPNPPAPRSPSRQEQKRDFLETVDESISGAMIVAAPFKYVGQHVDLHCVVSNFPEQDFVNALCPPDDDGSGPNVVIQIDATSLSAGQRLRVIAEVVEPMEGTNMMGGQTHFPTVKAEFAE